ncbi:IclR family transcriptional regulator [Salinirarus marinus]|uniref:IclR family transcriptional regulator n=2 Tax=Haloferacaceae TaxID=1644056 RepID=UPI003C6C5B70
MFRIVEMLMEMDGARLTDLANELDLPRSTTHRYLATLLECGCVVKEGNEYQLGLKFLDIGGYTRIRKDVYKLVEPKVAKLAERTEERTQFLVEEHGDIIYIHRATGPQGVGAGSRLGRRMPVNATSAGKVILAHMPDDEVSDLLDDHEFPKQTEHTITDRDEFLDELDRVRERGHGFNDQEYINGLRSVGVPVLHPDGRAIGAITVSGPTHRLEGDLYREQLPRTLKGVANEIELEIAYS